MEINEPCVSPDSIWPYLDVFGSCDNANAQYIVHNIATKFERPTVIDFLGVACSWGSLSFI